MTEKIEELLAEKEELIVELQTIHYQLTDSEIIDSYNLDRIVVHIEEVLKRFDALEY